MSRAFRLFEVVLDGSPARMIYISSTSRIRAMAPELGSAK